MKKIKWTKISVLIVMALAGALLISGNPASAEDRDQEQLLTQERIYGNELMTEQERAAYRERMRAAETNEQRERIRNEHHEQMKERARMQGITLPDKPPEHGMRGRMGTGGGMGYGGKGKGGR